MHGQIVPGEREEIPKLKPLNRTRGAALVAIVAAAALSLAASEGMWMPQQSEELAREMRAHGISGSARDLGDLSSAPLAAVVQISWGCSGAFVSGEGLILTNHHCAQLPLQYNSTPQRDLIKSGFVSASRGEELWNGPLSRVHLTTDMRDVTERMLGGLPQNASERQRYDLINEREKKIVAECEKGGGVRCFVGSFFGGLSYWLTVQQEIRDIRLVYAPPGAAGNFGGDRDNWMWPRHSADFALYRAYVAPDGSPADYSPENVPYRPAHRLKIAATGAEPGAPVLIVGFPARTSRFRSAGEISRILESEFPRSIRTTGEVLSIMEAASARSEEARLRNAAAVNSYANSLKYMRGVLDSLRPSDIRVAKAAEEDRIREGAEEVLARMAAIDERYKATAERDHAFYWLVKGSRLMNQAVVITRYALERPKKDADRLWGYQDRDVAQIRESIERVQRIYEPETERALLRYFLLEAASLPERHRIPAVDRVLSATGKPSPEEQVEAFVADALSRTRLHDLEARREMFRSSAETLRRRRDPLLDLAAALMPTMMEIRKRDEEAFAAMSSLRPRYFERLSDVRGGSLYSDANGSLRISFGRVEGFEPKDGVRYGPITTVSGISEKLQRGGAYERHPALVAAIEAEAFGAYRDERLGTLPVNFLSTNDTTSGNSGSPVLNAKGEVIGVAFDGNYEALGSDFLYDPQRSRSINVDSRYMLWFMEAVMPAPHLLRELSMEPKIAAQPACH